MKNKIMSYAILSYAVLIVHAALSAGAQQNSVHDSSHEYTPYGQMIHQFFWISYLNHDLSVKNPSLVHAWCDDLFSKNPPPCAYKDYIRSLLEKGRYHDIIRLVPLIDAQTKHDPHMQVTIALAFKQLGKQEEADRRFIALSSLFPTHQEIVFHAAESYIRRKELENALIVINSCLNKTAHKPHFFILYFEKAHIYSLLHDYDNALIAAVECAKKNPHFDKGVLLAASLHEKTGKIHEAIKYYKYYTEIARPCEAQRIFKHMNGLSLKQEATDKNGTRP